MLSLEQKAQARKDLDAALQAKIKLDNSIMVPDYLKDAVAAEYRLLDTLCIAAGVFDVSEVAENG